MKRLIEAALAVGFGAVMGWSAARVAADRSSDLGHHDTTTGVLAGARGALEAAARTLQQLERPPRTWDGIGGWRTPILARSEATWSDLLPWYDPALPVDPPRLEQCVSGPGVSVSGCRDIATDAHGLRFPGRGSWILDTFYGAVKVLVLDGTAERRRQAIDIATFVASNVVHSAADSRRFNPWRIEEIPALHVPRLFWSEQPVKDRCGGVAALAACVFDSEGFATRKVEIGTLEDGHNVAEVEVGDDEWIVVDVDWGYVFTDDLGSSLDLDTLRDRLVRHADVVAVDIGGGKRWLRPELNADGGSPFHWSPVCDDRPRDPDQLLDWLRTQLVNVRMSSFDTRLASERALERSERLERILGTRRGR